MSNDSDLKAFVVSLANGDESAWREFLRRYGPLMQSACHKVGLDAEDAADVVQVVCLRVLHNISALREPAAFASWVHGITVRLAYDVHRKRKRDFEGNAKVEVETRLAAELAEAPDEPLSRLEDIANLIDALGTLGARCQGLIWALYLDSSHPDYKAIADSLSLPMGSIGPTRARCLEKLEIELRKVSKTPGSPSSWRA